MRVMYMYECVPGIIYFVLLPVISAMVETAQDTREQRDEKFPVVAVPAAHCTVHRESSLDIC